MKKILLIVIGVVCGIVLSSELIFSFVLTPSVSKLGEAQNFEVPRGASLGRVAQDLESAGFITNGRLFKLYVMIRGSGRGVKMGEYHLYKGQTPSEILTILSSGKSIQYSVTFPEGSNIFQVAKILADTGRFPYEEALAAMRNPQIAEELLGVKLPGLEGYLFPETYKYTKFTTLKELLRAMTQRFLQTYERIVFSKPVNMTRHEVVTLASVIEKETGAPEERSLISSVFHNRLNKGMRLQSDPTIIYGMWLQSGREPMNISKKDILAPTPYNTYTVPKLPMGPIANPGREALEATLNPGVSEYLFFVSRNDGTHVFTKTYQEHSAAVRQFQLDRKAREGKSWRDLKSRPKTSP